MKRQTCLLILGSLLAFSLPLQTGAHYYQDKLEQTRREVNRKTLPFTKRLPSIDKVELLKIGSIGEGGEIHSIAETKSIRGKRAQNIASAWRSQSFDLYYSAMCHQPAYAIKFYSGNRVVLYASICWECHNIVILEPIVSGQGFKSNSRVAKMLLSFFREAFGKSNREG